MLALVGPSGLVLAEEPVEVVVPAVAPGLESVCDEPVAVVEVDADPAPVELGVGVGVPVGLCELDWLLPSPDEDCPEVFVPAPVDAVPAPEPWAEPESPGLA